LAVPSFYSGELEIHYEVVGRGSRLLFLNGSGASIATSKVLIDHLAQHFEVAVHDQRGLGRTGIGTTSSPYEMADYAIDARTFLDHLGWTSTRILGISFGGMVAQEFTVTWPERVERLALLCTSPGGAGGSSFPLHALADLSPEARRRQSQLLLDARFSDEWLNEHPDDQRLVQYRDHGSQIALSDEQREGARRQIDARSRHNCFERLGLITAPTLVAGGRYDEMAPADVVNALGGAIGVSETRFYDGGHLFVVQDPHALTEIIEFLFAATDDFG
jgi:3-oxoadipate enol-lactonase